MNDSSPWKTLSSDVIYDNDWIRLVEDQVINPAGKAGVYGKVCFKSQAVGIIPLDDDGNTYLVSQYRYTLSERCWEIPMGGSPLNEDCLLTAHRELEEETGLCASKMQKIQRLHTSNSITDEEGFVFLATGLSKGKQQLEDSELDMQIKKLPLDEAVAMAQNGEITDAISIAGLLFVALNKKSLGLI